MPIQQKTVIYSEFPPGHEEMEHAVNHESYDYLAANSPMYLSAVEAAVAKGATPEEVLAYISRLVGPDRQPIAKRCAQAAAYIRRQQADNFGTVGVTTGGTLNITPSGVRVGNLGA